MQHYLVYFGTEGWVVRSSPHSHNYYYIYTNLG